MKILSWAFIVATFFVTGSAFGAQVLCGVQVQDGNILRAGNGESVNFVRAVLQVDRAAIRQCFDVNGAVVVGTFPNGEVRAVIF